MQYPPEHDLMIRAVPCPNDIDPSPHAMLVLRVRAKPWIASAAVHVSVDGFSYLQVEDSLPHVVGIHLIEPLADGSMVSIVGPDANLLRVLSDGDWRIGRQPLLIDDEWCFVRELEAAGEDLYRIHGLLRGRLGSRACEHSGGTTGFIADVRHLIPIRDASVRPGHALWVKTQPYSGRSLPLTECVAQESVLTKHPSRVRRGIDMLMRALAEG